MTTLTFQTPDEARAWDMYACANIGCGEWDMMFACADAMILERRKRMAPAESKPEREWIPHKPGDPMPCDGDDWVSVKFWDGSACVFQKTAKTHNWGKDTFPMIVAWRLA